MKGNIAALVLKGKLNGKTLGVHKKSQRERRERGEPLVILKKEETTNQVNKKTD